MASVLNRTTKQLIDSANTPEYPTANWIHNPDLSAVGGVDSSCWVIEGDTVRAMTAGEKDVAHLQETKDAKSISIDERTEALISSGFEYPTSSGQIFSLSDVMQRNLVGLHNVKDNIAVTYPIAWNFKDNSDKLIITSATVLDAFYLTAMGTVRAHRDSGTVLKDQVRSAATVAEVDAVVDSR